MDILNELYYGNIIPFERRIAGDARYSQLRRCVSRHRESLEGTLTSQQKEVFQKFTDCNLELQGLTEQDAFTYGFRLGAQLMLAATQESVEY